MARADKATAVADITEQFNAATATLITEYRGLTCLLYTSRCV